MSIVAAFAEAFGQSSGGGISAQSQTSSGGRLLADNTRGGRFVQNTGGSMSGQSSGGAMFGSSTGGGIFGQNITGGMFGQNASGGSLGQNAGGGGAKLGTSTEGGIFGQNITGGMFGQNTGSGSLGQNTGGAIFGRSTGGAMFGTGTGGGFLGQNTSGGTFIQTGGSIFGQNASGGSLGQHTGGVYVGQNDGGIVFGTSAGGGCSGQNISGGTFGQTGGSTFGQNTSRGTFGQHNGGGMFGQSTGGFSGPSISGGMFGQTGGSIFVQNASGGTLGQNTSGGVFGQNLGGGILGTSTGTGFSSLNTGGGTFSQTGGTMFGQNSGGGQLAHNPVGCMLTQSTGSIIPGSGIGDGFAGLNAGIGMVSQAGGSIFGQNIGGGLLGQNIGSDMFGTSQSTDSKISSQSDDAMFRRHDPYGFDSILSAAAPPSPKPVGLIMPKTLPLRCASLLWNSYESVKPRPPAKGTGKRSPRNANSGIALTDNARLSPVDKGKPSSTPQLKKPSCDHGHHTSWYVQPTNCHSDDCVDDQPPLQMRQPLNALDHNLATAAAPGSKSVAPQIQTIRPAFVQHVPEIADNNWNAYCTIECPPGNPTGANLGIDKPEDASKLLRDAYSSQHPPAPSAMRPTMKRPDFFSNPSLEQMESMTEEQLSQIVNLEVGRHGFGSITWSGLTDVRCIDFDTAVCIERGLVAVYPDGNRPAVGNGLNKEAIVRLNVKPSRGASDDAFRWQERMKELTEVGGNTFISYDLEVWMFKVPHFELREQ